MKRKLKEGVENHKSIHEGYEYYKWDLVEKQESRQCAVSYYEIPPRQSPYPYHYHLMDEEVFYVIKGEGLLKTPAGEEIVTAGDLLYFPPCEKGAHKITNTSETEVLAYLDFDTSNLLDVALYPDSGKIGVFGKGLNQIYRTEDQVGYYDKE